MGKDDYAVQQLTETGCFSHFDHERPRDLMVMQNGSGAGRVPQKICSQLTAEEEKGLLSAAYEYLPFCPAATPRCTTVPKDGVADERVVFDFTQFRNQQDGGGLHSINAGLARFDTDLLKPLVLIQIKQFCQWLGLLQCAGAVDV